MKRKIDMFLVILFLCLGFVLGAMLIYKIEVNTMNQAYESIEYCYDEYAIPSIKYYFLTNITIPKDLSLWNNGEGCWLNQTCATCERLGKPLCEIQEDLK